MKTVTKREDFIYIVYDEELKRKCDIVLSLHVILWMLIPMYILLFRANDKIYNYLWIIFYVFFIISYKLEPYLSKIKIILYEDKIEIKKRKKTRLFLYSEIKEIKYNKKYISKVGEISFIKIMKKNKFEILKRLVKNKKMRKKSFLESLKFEFWMILVHQFRQNIIERILVFLFW